MEENLSQFPMFQGLIDEVNEKIEGLHITQHYYLSVILRTQAIFSTTFPNTYLADNRFNREEFEIRRFLKEKGGQSTYDQLAPLLVADIDTIDKIISSIDEFSSQRDLLPVALKKEIAKSIVTKLPSVYFFAVPDSGYFGYDFMAMAYIENFYPIAMPQKPLKAHGEEMSPQWFSFHDYGHLISDIE